MKDFRLMILSVGSLVGQNILDSLEGRRHRLRVIGLNSLPDNPRVFRCDRAYLVPSADSPEFESRLTDIIGKEDPDLILPGRDDDILTLIRLRQCRPEWKKKIPMGSLEAAEIMDDKSRSAEFAKKHGLPFAPTVALRQGERAIGEFVKEQGFPLIAKPAAGFGSQGIRILTKESHVRELTLHGDEATVLQPVLGMSKSNREAIERFDRQAAMGIPFFFHLPDEMQYASQTLIGPGGEAEPPFCSLSTMVLGRCEKSAPLEDPDFVEVSRRYARAIALEGWVGMFNLQCRKTEGGYVGIEMNGRMSGSTSARSLMGYDEIRMFINRFFGLDIGQDSRARGVDGMVMRSLTDAYVSFPSVSELGKKGVWEPNPVSGRAVLTGATGYIGHALVGKLQDRGTRLTVLTRSPDKARQLGSGVEVLEAENYDAVAWPEVDTLIHLGFARPHHGQEALNASMEYSARLLDHAARAGVRSVIFISSRSVYGTPALLPVDESTPANPSSPYGVAKRAVELLMDSLRLHHPATKFTSVRLGAVNGAGPEQVDVSAVSKFVRAAKAGERISILGGRQTTDLLDLRDAAEALGRLVACPAAERSDMYVVASPAAFAILDIASKCVELSGNPKASLSLSEAGESLSYAMDPSRFARQFDWTPRFGLDSIIRSLLDQEAPG